MKKLLLAAAILLASVAAKAQATEIFYFNHNPTSLTLHLQDNSTCAIISAPAISVPTAPLTPGYNHITIGASAASTYPTLVPYDPAFYSIVGVTAILYSTPYTVGEPTTTACGTPTGFPLNVGGMGPFSQFQVSFGFPTFWGPNIVDLRDF